MAFVLGSERDVVIDTLRPLARSISSASVSAAVRSSAACAALMTMRVFEVMRKSPARRSTCFGSGISLRSCANAHGDDRKMIATRIIQRSLLFIIGKEIATADTKIQ